MAHSLKRIFKHRLASISQNVLRYPQPSLIHATYRFNTTYTVPVNVERESELNKEVSEDVLRRRLIFRCKNRGIKELDLLMGNWAMEYVDTLSMEECAELQTVLNEETLDLVSILLKTKQIPDQFSDNSIMHRLAKYRDDGNITGYAK